MSIVTACSTLENGRLCFHLDNGTKLVLYRGEARKFRMQEGSVLSEEEEYQLIHEVIGKRAKKRAMHLIEQMDRTEHQLRDKLVQGGYPQVCVEQAIAYVKSYHYIDDRRYACTYIRYRQDRMSRQQLKLKLAGKGVAGDVIEQALEETYEGDEAAQIARLLEKKHYDAQTADQKEFRRVYQFLMRRGFKSSDVLKAMKNQQ